MMLVSKSPNKEVKNSATMNAIAAMVFVLIFLASNLVHADHIASHTINAEQQECYICHQGLDTPPELSQVKNSFVVSYNVKLYALVTAELQVNNFVKPPLRAPPVFL